MCRTEGVSPGPQKNPLVTPYCATYLASATVSVSLISTSQVYQFTTYIQFLFRARSGFQVFFFFIFTVQSHIHATLITIWH